MTRAGWFPRGPLTDKPWLAHLVRDALRGEGSFPGVAADAAAFLAPRAMEPAPAWSSPWFAAWSEAQLEAQPDGASRARVARHLDALAAGAADVVVTGQQPGFLGGPFYTLLKVATCIAAAEARTRAGRLTVPLFWSGDADDDSSEAVAVRIWDHRRDAFLKPVLPSATDGRMVGALPASLLGAAELAWFKSVNGDLAAALSRLWDEAIAADRDWGGLHARAVQTVFAGSGLLTVSGNDSDMIAIAAPFLGRAIAMGEGLADAARETGTALSARGYHAQITETSLGRPLHHAVGGQRRRLPTIADAADVPARDLRPGVLLRSPLQDWLFRPAGVVVGPGERAYLEQLRPLYAVLGLERAPLLPRAHAHLGRQSEAESESAEDVTPHVEAVLRSASAELARALSRLGSPDADERAGRIAQRWRSAVTKGLNAAVQSRVDRDGDDVGRDTWRNPRGARQERILPGLWAATLLSNLPATLLDLADDHLHRCAAGDLCEYEIHVDETDLEEQR